MEWQAVVMALQILMLAVGWTLFQKARAELSAKAAEEPVLSEVRALQRQVKELLNEIEEAGDAVTAKIEGRCVEARELLMALEHRLMAAQEAADRPAAPRRSSRRAAPETAAEAPDDAPVEAVVQTSQARQTAAKPAAKTSKSEVPAAASGKRAAKQKTQAPLSAEAPRPRGISAAAENTPPSPELSAFALRRSSVYALADQGEPPAAIARQTGLSEGEVETLLGLRLQR